MDSIHAEVYRSSGLQEVVRSYAALRRKVPYTGVRGSASLRGVGKVQIAHARILACGVQHSARSLHPGHQPMAVGEVPTHDDRRDTEAVIGTAANHRAEALRSRGRTRLAVHKMLKLRRERLPVRNQLDRVFQVALEPAMAEFRRDYLAQLHTRQQKRIIRALRSEEH